ncbi:hypothetical protein AGABI1DRAFT_80003 [Agaricus bisporus var. burnettii JB137-S8]|uniref:Uncharacterized protein n=2 Tax=Agaricus bisporus var. burnettii TaxID=192524 RepID=K5VLV2_AGABU|nr:hypothetical protein AGABI2DRAFT_76734 [Agaricus bisporus var. bisporus H97]XP_007333977.1 uncharacterized protein AGABI1DRAFT_80003 [Agaricus bisporus var. burnettii JB137-S8]EKM75399.1 hypothetical protein AGABI1DRAFT_80003 [Agaricus bisporus var. burnettii JB137-S8]EKV43500.1 hypothetical protein AGABI2DRAFT_76734 [Agaricus bisporus var. bisporus H97]KAF7759695.1 hypothetical protein Agabi119p4_11390 [Agaricus bisporus var. burnettii]
MCKHEVVGDYYRGCGHFHLRYFTGKVSDCDLTVCKTSKKHAHGNKKNCDCPEVIVEDRKVENLFQNPFSQCQRTTR